MHIINGCIHAGFNVTLFSACPPSRKQNDFASSQEHSRIIMSCYFHCWHLCIPLQTRPYELQSHSHTAWVKQSTCSCNKQDKEKELSLMRETLFTNGPRWYKPMQIRNNGAMCALRTAILCPEVVSNLLTLLSGQVGSWNKMLPCREHAICDNVAIITGSHW